MRALYEFNKIVYLKWFYIELSRQHFKGILWHFKIMIPNFKMLNKKFNEL